MVRNDLATSVSLLLLFIRRLGTRHDGEVCAALACSPERLILEPVAHIEGNVQLETSMKFESTLVHGEWSLYVTLYRKRSKIPS